MQPAPRPQYHDPELDPPLRPTAPDGPHELLPEYQRLLANPFLAVVWLVLVFALVQQAVRAGEMLLVGLSLVGVIVAGFLLQYHCLDCGHTGRLTRWKRHACPAVLARFRAGRVPRLRGPNPGWQTVIWVYLLGSLAVLVTIISLASRT